MNKKFLTAFLFGASVLASTSTFVSCKDYSDEIDALQTQIDNANALHATKAELAAAKAELTAAYEKADAELKALVEQYKAALDAKDADLQKQISDEITRAQAKEAVIEANIEALDKAHKELLDLKVDKTTFTDEVAKIYAEIKACSDKCAEKLAEEVGKLQTADAELQKQIDKLVKDLADTNAEVAANKTTLLTLKADFEKQKAACEKFQEAIDGRVSKIEADYLTSADKKELNDKIDAVKKDLQEQINSLAERLGKAEAQIDANKKDIATLKTKVEALEKAVEKINKELVALTYLVKTSLRSLVFIPDSYYWGVEATEINYLEYAKYELANLNATADAEKAKALAETHDNALGTLVRKVDGETDFHKGVAKYVEGSKVLKFAANYHLNPSKANLEGAKFALVTGDRDYKVDTKSFNEADALLSIVGTPTAADGILTVKLNADKPELIKRVVDNQAVTIFATQVTLPKDGKGAVADTTITSDYATLYKSTIKDLVISHAHHTMYKGIDSAGERADQDDLYNDHCGGDIYWVKNGGEKTADCNHLFATEDEAIASIEVGEGPQDSVNWNATLDLRTLVETHYTNEDGTHILMDAKRLESVGLKYVFDLVGYYSGKNKTEESVHAAINPEDGYTLRPQMPTETVYNPDGTYKDGGHQMPYGKADQAETTIGRTPIVRVALVDVDDPTIVYDYGYIPLKITRPSVNPTEKDVVSVSYVGKGIAYNWECEPKDVTMDTKWDMIEWDIYHGILNIDKLLFDKHYHIVKIADSDKLQQYDPNDKFKAYAGIGDAYEKFDDTDAQTHTVNWTVYGANFYKYFITDKKTSLVTAVKYESDDKYNYPDVYIILNQGAITVTRPQGEGVIDKTKIYEYWYKSETMEHGTYDEVHVNTYEPENENGATTAARLQNTVVAMFHGNKIDVIHKDTETKDAAGKTPYDLWAAQFPDYVETKLNKVINFSAKNNGRKFNAIDGNFYEVKISDDALTLNAIKCNDKDITPVAIAKIVNPAVGTNTQVVYQTNDIAKAILNNTDSKHLAKAEDGKFNSIFATLILKAKSCYELPLAVEEWDVRYLRPINVVGVPNYYMDASTDEVTEHDDHVINIRDLVALCDWRSKTNWLTSEADRVWSEKCTDACSGKADAPAHAADYEKDYWNFYQVTSIEIIGAGETNADGIVDISSTVTTDLNKELKGSQLGKTPLSTVSKLVHLYYHPVTKANPCFGTPESFGTLTYTNRGENVGEFNIRVPLKVNYIWGYVTTTVDLKINQTLNDNQSKKR